MITAVDYLCVHTFCFVSKIFLSEYVIDFCATVISISFGLDSFVSADQLMMAMGM